MRVINLVGGPNTGKTTTALGLTYFMKLAGLKVKYVSEYAEDMVYEERANILADQPYILAKQNRKLHRLRGLCDFVVTDSPLFLSIVYARGISPTFEKMIWEQFNSYQNETFFLNRDTSFDYQEQGRVQGSHQECEAIDERIMSVLPTDTEFLTPGYDYVRFIANALGLDLPFPE